MKKLTIGGVDYVPADALTKAFADGMLAGNDFGREITRREIRRAQAKALRTMRAAHCPIIPKCACCWCLEIKSIDTATRPWRPKKREQSEREGRTG